MKRVVIESPYAGKAPGWPWPLKLIVEWWRRRLNIAYLRAAMHDCLHRGEAPYASHALYTQPGVLRDWLKWERDLGITAGFQWGAAAEETVVYCDRGITPGMEWGIAAAAEANRPVTFRSLDAWKRPTSPPT